VLPRSGDQEEENRKRMVIGKSIFDFAKRIDLVSRKQKRHLRT
jgi:hypothetical protein